MGILKGKDGAIRLGSGAGSPLLHVQSWNLDISTDTNETWSMGDDWSDNHATVKKFGGSVECYFDFADATRPSVGDTIQFDLYPGGETTGSGYFSGSALVTGTPISGAKDGTPTISFNFVNKGALTEATVK